MLSVEVSSGVNSLAYFLAKITTDIPLFAFYAVLFMGTFTLLASPKGKLEQYYIVFFALEFAVWGFGYTLSMFIRRENCGLVAVVLALIWSVCNGVPFSVHKMGLLGTISCMSLSISLSLSLSLKIVQIYTFGWMDDMCPSVCMSFLLVLIIYCH